MKTVAIAARDDPAAWLEMRQINGNLADEAQFAGRFRKLPSMIWDDGLENAIASYLDA